MSTGAELRMAACTKHDDARRHDLDADAAALVGDLALAIDHRQRALILRTDAGILDDRADRLDRAARLSGKLLV